jgi:hypothetical protein
MENKCLSVDIGKITVSVKMDDAEEYIVESAWKTYSEFGFEVKQLEEEE